MTRSPRLRLAALRGAPARLAAVAGLVVFAVLAGTTASYAYFQMAQQATATATSGSLSVSTANFASMAYQFRNDQLDTVGSFTVANASDTGETVARTATITLASATADSTQAKNAVSYVVWQKGATETCATGHSKTGATTWANATTLTAALAPGASITYCVESYAASASSLAVAGGSLTLTPTLTASLAASSWTAQTIASAAQNSVAIYPATTVPTTSWYFVHPVSAPTSCWDDANFGTASGSLAIDYGCKTTTTGNQQWAFEGSVAGYEIVNRSAQSLRLDSQGTTSGANVNLVTDASTASQTWTAQLVSGTGGGTAGVYQFINKASNLCLSVGAQQSDGLVHLIQSPCVGASAQQFTLETAQLESFACTTTGTGTGQRIQYSWSTAYNAADNGPYTFSTTYGGASRTIATAASGSASVAVNGDAPAGNTLRSQANGTYTVTVTDADGTVVATGQVVVRSGGLFATKYLTCT